MQMHRVHIWGIFLLAISCGVLSQVVPKALCRDPPAKANFNIKRFLGRWYEAYSTGSPPPYTCYTTDYVASNRTLRGGGTQFLNGDWRKDVTTVGTFGVNKYSAKINYTVNGGAALQYTQYSVKFYVLETDYANYALLWRCVSSNATESVQENAWIFGRRTRLSPLHISYLSRRLPFYGIETLNYFTSPQGPNCTYPTCI